MFDDTPPCWQQDIAIGDIVLFRFPTTEKEGVAPKRRPCLVLETARIGGQRFVKIAYGSSAYGSSNRGREVIVRHDDSIAAAGLNRPSRFTLNRCLTVSLAHPGFEVATHGAPRIGRLDAALMERLHKLRAWMHAQADIAADHRRARKDDRRRWQDEGRMAAERNRALLQGQAQVGGAR